MNGTHEHPSRLPLRMPAVPAHSLCIELPNTCNSAACACQHSCAQPRHVRIPQELVIEKMPKLAEHLSRISCDVTIVATDWFLCLFCTTLPSEVRLDAACSCGHLASGICQPGRTCLRVMLPSMICRAEPERAFRACLLEV